jgi:hypothetical protein
MGDGDWENGGLRPVWGKKKENQKKNKINETLSLLTSQK